MILVKEDSSTTALEFHSIFQSYPSLNACMTTRHIYCISSNSWFNVDSKQQQKQQDSNTAE